MHYKCIHNFLMYLKKIQKFCIKLEFKLFLLSGNRKNHFMNRSRNNCYGLRNYFGEEKQDGIDLYPRTYP